LRHSVHVAYSQVLMISTAFINSALPGKPLSEDYTNASTSYDSKPSAIKVKDQNLISS